ncbi:MAG: hypothetical protein ACLQO7_09180 [Candidatus Bathyarchaeia archaeon]
MGKKDSKNIDLSKFGRVSKRFSMPSKCAKGEIAKDRFAFDQTMQGHDCRKIRDGGDFIVLKRDFFGNEIGEPTVFEVKTGNSSLTEAQEKRQRQLGRRRYKIARY